MIFLSHTPGVNWTHPLARDLLAWWLCLPGMNEGGIWNNLCARPGEGGFHGTMTNFSPKSGTVGFHGARRPGGFGSMGFNGSNSTILVNTAGHMFPRLRVGTFMGWAFPTSAVAGRMFTHSTQDTIWLVCDNNGAGGKFHAIALVYDGGNKQVNSSLYLPRFPYHVTMTWDATIIRLYVNAKLDGTLAAGAPNYVGAEFSLAIGSNATPSGAYFTGYLDDMRVYTRPLAPEEIQYAYENSSVGCPGLLRRASFPMTPPGGFGSLLGSKRNRLVRT